MTSETNSPDSGGSASACSTAQAMHSWYARFIIRHGTNASSRLGGRLRARRCYSRGRPRAGSWTSCPKRSIVPLVVESIALGAGDAYYICRTASPRERGREGHELIAHLLRICRGLHGEG